MCRPFTLPKTNHLFFEKPFAETVFLFFRFSFFVFAFRFCVFHSPGRIRTAVHRFKACYPKPALARFPEKRKNRLTAERVWPLDDGATRREVLCRENNKNPLFLGFGGVKKATRTLLKKALGLFRSNDEMVDDLVARGVLRTPEIIAAFRAVDRARFVPPALRSQAYEDYALPVAAGQTISQPLIVAAMTEALEARSGDRVLDVGTGTGYQAALLSEIVGKRGRVFGVERLKELLDYASQRLIRYKNVDLRLGDGSLGWKEKAPFDRVVIAAAAPRLPQPVVEQTKVGGVIVAPVEGMLWLELAVFRKTSKGFDRKALMPVVFVPLVGEHGYRE